MAAYKANIKNETYGLTLKLRISKSFAKEKYFKKHLEGDYSGCNALVVQVPGEGLQVWFDAKNIEHPVFLAGVIAHECVHIVNKIYIDRYIQLDRSNDEPQAYLLSFFVEKIHYHIEQYKKRKTKK